MQVFKLLFKIARSKIGISILFLVLFLAVCFPMVKATEEQNSFEDSSLSLYVYDEDQSNASKKLIENLGKKYELVELQNDRQAILDAMYYEIVDYSLVIKKGYEERLRDLDKKDETELFQSYHMRDSFPVAMMGLYLSDYVRSVREKLALGLTFDEAVIEAEKALAKEIPVEIVPDPDSSSKDEGFTERFSIFFNMLSYMLIAVIANALCPILISLNRGEKRKRIECSRVSVSSYITQIFIGSALLVILIWLSFMASGMILYGGFYRGTKCALAIVNSFIFAMLAAMFTIFLCSFNLTTTSIGMISQISAIGMSFLGGAFFPQTMLSGKVLAVGRLFPTYWYVRANSILSGAVTGTMGDVGLCFGILLGFFLLFLILTIVVSSRHPRARRRRIA